MELLTHYLGRVCVGWRRTAAADQRLSYPEMFRLLAASAEEVAAVVAVGAGVDGLVGLDENELHLRLFPSAFWTCDQI